MIEIRVLRGPFVGLQTASDGFDDNRVEALAFALGTLAKGAIDGLGNRPDRVLHAHGAGNKFGDRWLCQRSPSKAGAWTSATERSELGPIVTAARVIRNERATRFDQNVDAIFHDTRTAEPSRPNMIGLDQILVCSVEATDACGETHSVSRTLS